MMRFKTRHYGVRRRPMVSFGRHFQLAIVGEAFNRARRSDPNLAIEFGAISEWISLRNIVIHAYDGIDFDLIWTTIPKEIPELIATLERLLGEDPQKR